MRLPSSLGECIFIHIFMRTHSFILFKMDKVKRIAWSFLCILPQFYLENKQITIKMKEDVKPQSAPNECLKAFYLYLRRNMSKILNEGNSSFNQFIKAQNTTKATFRGKPLTIRNLYHQYSQKTSQEQKRQPSADNTRKLNPMESSEKQSSGVMEHTCSKFMRSYIDKLKKQRKREKKKIEEASHFRTGEGTLGQELASLPSIPHGKVKFFATKKIHPLTFRSTSEQPSQTPQTPEIGHLVSMLKDIKEQSQHRHRRHFSQGLPALSRGKRQQRIEVLDPWQNVVDYQQASFEQYK